MIHQAAVSVETLWQKELKQSFSRPEQLLAFLQIDASGMEQDIAARQLFPMRVPRHFAGLMEKGNRHDPLLLQVLPLRQEFIQHPEFVTDPLNEQTSRLPGLLHKYKSRVLIIFRGGCAVNCRYCFRRHFPYQDNSVNKQQLLAHLDYIKHNSSINEVILSGGDPLMAGDEHLSWFLDEIEKLKQIKRVRIHSRLPVVIPNRITSSFIQTIAHRTFKSILVLHINHANEISDTLVKGIAQLRSANVTVLNQAVLLRDINDEISAQVNLSERLFEAGIMPYYLFLLDKVAGATHYDVNETDALALYRDMLVELPGFLVPKLAREIGGEASKTPILPY